MPVCLAVRLHHLHMFVLQSISDGWRNGGLSKRRETLRLFRALKIRVSAKWKEELKNLWKVKKFSEIGN